MTGREQLVEQDADDVARCAALAEQDPQVRKMFCLTGRPSVFCRYTRFFHDRSSDQAVQDGGAYLDIEQHQLLVGATGGRAGAGSGPPEQALGAKITRRIPRRRCV